MLLEDLLAAYPTKYRLCKELNLSQANLYYWKNVGYIPIQAQYIIQETSNGKFVANNKHGRRTRNARKHGFAGTSEDVGV